jgi:putative aminopeptidase FrvX
MVKYIKHTLLLTTVIVISIGLFAQNAKISKYIGQIDSTKIRTVLSTLSSDALEGRGTGAKGGEVAQEYIVAYLDSCGVVAGNNGSYFQSLNYIRSLNVAKRRCVIDGVDYPDDYKYGNMYHQDTTLKIAEIVFISAGKDIDSVKPDNLEGKVVMKLDEVLPDYIDNQNPATVVNILSDFKPASSKVSEKYLFNPPASKYKYNRVSISVNLANKLLQSTGKTLTEIAAEVEKSGKSKIITLTTPVEIDGNVIYHKTNVNNIIGVVEGSELKNEYVVLSAHHDHVGIINDEIYNGADDNASGVASVLEVARLIAKARSEGIAPRRSVIILLPATEEMGLIGSSHYVNNPIFPLTDTKACVNVDMVGRIDDKYQSSEGDYLYIVNDKNTSGKLLELAETANVDNITLNTQDLNSLFKRSDHYNFAKHNIPAVLLTSGLHKDYHTPRDDAERIRFDAMWKRNRFIFSLIWNLANSD